MPAHLYRALGERLQNSDKESAIELYYELLSSGHSVGEILNNVDPVHRRFDCKNLTSEGPQPGSAGMTTDLTGQVASVGEEQVNVLCTCGLNVPHDAERCRIEKQETAQSAPVNDLGSNYREQRRHESLPEPEPEPEPELEIVRPTGTQVATGRERSIHSSYQGRARPSKPPSTPKPKQIVFVALYTVAIASVSIASFSILPSDRDAESIITRIQSAILRGAEAVKGLDIAVAKDLKPTKQETNAFSSRGPESLRPAEQELAVSGLPQSLPAGVRAQISAALPGADAVQGSKAGQQDVVEQSDHAAVVIPDLTHEPIPLTAHSPSAATAGTPLHSEAKQPDTGDPLHATRTAPVDPAVLLEALPIAPTQAAEAADNAEPAQTRPIETAKSTKLAPAAAAETKHGLKETGRGLMGPVATAEAAQAKQPDIVLPPPREAAAALAPRTTDITADEQRFKKAEADALLSRGDEFFAAGDLASARIFYEYAAAAGNGAAALRLGGTFDPAFLARIRIGRVQGDLPSALYWYRRARDLGSGDAEILLRRMEKTSR